MFSLETKAKESARMAETQKGRVLIVEDDLLLSMVEERLINNLGYEVVGKVSSGEEAIKKEKELQPDVIVMDISLKGAMDGIDAMKEIRKSSDVAVIYLSGSSDETHIERAGETHYSGYLTKPITSGDLRGPLEKAIESRGVNVNSEDE